MFHITEELGILKNGFNFYPWKDRKTSGIGIKLKIGNRLWAVRYSPFRKRIFFHKVLVDTGVE
jgi:hypothetical protein